MGKFENEYQVLAPILMEYGGLLPPTLLTGEWGMLNTYCQNLIASPPTSDEERSVVELELNAEIMDTIFHPNNRAHCVNMARTLPHLEKFSHNIEQASFHYYKHEFLSCSLCLTPAVEGVLLSYCGWARGMPKLSQKDIRDTIRNKESVISKNRRDMYAESLASFHEKWFWKNTDNADFRLSYLNRHFMLHGLSTESFYRSIDCLRLFSFFNLFTEMVLLETGGSYVFIPIEDPPVARRQQYYFKLIEEDPTLSEMKKFEEALLTEHKYFVRDEDPPNLFKSIRHTVKVMSPILGQIFDKP